MILVTGATGTIGSALVEVLAAAGEPVRAMTRRSVAVPAGVELVHGDYADAESLRAAAKGADAVFLLDAAGPLKERIRAGTLVAGRRWTLKMDNGMDVRLPELGATDALARLVKLENEQKILEKDVLAIDLRMADRVVVRLTEEAALARAEALKKKPMRGKGVDT